MDFVITARTSVSGEPILIGIVLSVVFATAVSACEHNLSTNGLGLGSRSTIIKGRGRNMRTPDVLPVGFDGENTSTGRASDRDLRTDRTHRPPELVDPGR